MLITSHLKHLSFSRFFAGKSGIGLKSALPILMICIYGGIATVIAQDGTVGDTDIEVFNISGSISTEAHGYTTTRSANRRAPLGNVTTANASFSVLGFDSGINFRYNTDDSELRQSINRVGFNGSWRWVSLSAGDVTPSWSSYSLRGTRVRGGHVELTPGEFIFEITGGRTQRAVGPQDDDEIQPRRLSFERMLYGTRIGFGDQTRGHYFALSGFYARDDKNSITLPDSDALLEEQRNYSPPAENLLISPEMHLSFFDQAFQLGIEATASTFTRDLTSNQIDPAESDVPDFFGSLMNIHSSTRLGFAGTAHAAFNVSPFDVRLQYDRVNPGFRSLGLRSIRDDQQRYSADVGVEFFNQRLRLDNRIGYDQDNLLGNRVQTQQGFDYNVDATGQLSESMSLTVGYGIVSNSVEATDPETATGTSDHTTQTFQFQPTYNIAIDDITHSISFSGFYQSFETITETQQADRATGGQTLNSTLNYSISFFDGLNLNTSLNGLVGDAAGSDMLNLGVNAGVGYSFFDGDLTTNVNFGGSRNKTTPAGGEADIQNISWQFNGRANLSYQILSSTSLDFSVRTNNNTISEGAGSGFSEFESRLSFSYRF